MNDPRTGKGSGVRRTVAELEVRAAQIAIDFEISATEAVRFASDLRARIDDGWPTERAARVLVDHRRRSPLFGWPKLDDAKAAALVRALLSEEAPLDKAEGE